MTTQNDENRRADVLEHEPVPGDRSRHTNKSYTLTRREGALPDEVAVISDMDSMYKDTENSIVFDLYEIGGLREGEICAPFVHGIELAGPKGEIVRFRSVFGDGALVNAIDKTMYQTLKGRLLASTPSNKILCMVDGRQVLSIGLWKGRVSVKGIHWEGTFEVFNSNGAWAMLFGKPLLKTFNAVHEYTEDTIRIPQTGGKEWTVLVNQFANTGGIAGKLLANLTIDIKQLIKPSQPLVVLKEQIVEPVGDNRIKGETKQKEHQNTYKLRGGVTTPLEESPIHQPHGSIKPHIISLTALNTKTTGSVIPGRMKTGVQYGFWMRRRVTAPSTPGQNNLKSRRFLNL